jgi:tRNA (guanine6-N2)-methyltransferase
MARRRNVQEKLPPCYAVVLPGLEPVAEDEIARELGGEVKQSRPGLVVFRVPEIDQRLLHLRTTEDVFLLAWGTDQLTYRAVDLDKIERWTAREPNWEQLLRIHHAIRPKPKGKPTYRLVTQMTGHHGYRRVDAGKAMARGLDAANIFPASWLPAEENASVEVWLTIHGAMAVCGLRLSDKTMRHRTYKFEHLPASLRPTVAASMARLAELKSKHAVLDPMCGAGTVLAEVMELAKREEWRTLSVWGGDLETASIRASVYNLRRVGKAHLGQWDARRLPLAGESMDRVVSNLPFGKQLSTPEEIGPLYRRSLREFDRVLRPYGVAVLLVSDWPALKSAAGAVGWKMLRQLRVRVLGQQATLAVWRKGAGSAASNE